MSQNDKSCVSSSTFDQDKQNYFWESGISSEIDMGGGGGRKLTHFPPLKKK